MAYDAVGGYDLLFGGENASGLFSDTWIYEAGNWTELNPSTAPDPRAYASMAFDPALNETILFGGLALTTSSDGNLVEEAASDTWAWNATTSEWSSLTNSLSGRPPARYGASMVWDAEQGALVLFGGNSGSGALNDTWELKSGAWTELSEAVAPSARWGAAFANSTQGYDLLFGGQDLTSTDGDTWIFFDGTWTEVTVCGGCGPYARSYAAASAIPATGNIVLFGGTEGSTVYDDAWFFTANLTGASGPTGTWTQDPSPPPPAVWAPSAASDYHRGVIVFFGGSETVTASVLSNQTWGYFHLYALLVTSTIEARQNQPFDLTTEVFGGNAPFTFDYTVLPPGCTSSNVSLLVCTPSYFGIDPLTVEVMDARGRFAEANASIQIDPATAQLEVLSEYSGFFYTGLNVTDTIGINATVFGETPVAVRATYGSLPLTFLPDGNGVWNASANMGAATPGATMYVTATFANWTLRGTYQFDIVETPSWLFSIANYTFASATLSSTDTGPWNQTYTLAYTETWGLGFGLFNIPTSWLDGSFDLIPIPQATLTVASSGAVLLTGGLAYPPPGISFGPITLQINFPDGIIASVSVQGQFSPSEESPGVYGIDWTGAWLNITLGATFEGSYPIVGVDVPGVGDLGISLEYKISPTVALSFLLAPTEPGQSDLISGIQLSLESLFAVVAIDLEGAISAGIEDVATVEGGGDLSIALAFGSVSPYFDGVWLNGSMYLAAQFLIWKVTWTFLGPGTIWSWTADPPVDAAAAATTPSTQPAPQWTLIGRYYNSSQYDSLSWTPGTGQAVAISDIYPQASPSIAGGPAGATIVYASDDVDAAPGSINLEALGVNASSASVARLPTLAPGTAVFDPIVGTVAGGGSIVVFDTVPMDSFAMGTPEAIPGFDEESAELAPGGTAWSSPTSLIDWGFPQSPVVGSCGGTDEVATLVSPTIFPGPTAMDSLVVQNAASGAVLANVSTYGLARVTGFDCSEGIVAVQNTSGNSSIIDLVSGVETTPSVNLPAGATLRSIGFVNGTADTLVLGYSSRTQDWAVLYDLGDGTAVATLALPLNSSGLEAAAVSGGYYLFAEETNRVVAFYLDGETTTTVALVNVTGLRSFNVAPSGNSFVVEAIGENNDSAEPIDALTIAIVAGPSSPSSTTPPTPPPKGTTPPATTSTKTSSALTALDYLEIGVLVVLVAAVVVVLISRRRRPPATEDPPPAATTSAYDPSGPPSPLEGPPGPETPPP